MSADKPPKSGDLRPARGNALGNDDASSQALNEALGSSLVVIRALVIALVAAFFISCIFTVNPNEVAIVLRFGKPVGTGVDMIRKQGLHFALPQPIDEVVRIRNGETLTVTTFTPWFQLTPDELLSGKLEGEASNGTGRLNPAAEGHVLTADGNIVHVRGTVKYRISDPVAFVFNFTSVSNLLLNAFNNAIYRTAAGFKADDVLYKNTEGFRLEVAQRLQDWVARTQLGVKIDLLEVPTIAPLSVREAFVQVTKAELERTTRIKQAEGDALEILRKAEAESREILNRGIIASNQLVAAVSGDADSFRKQLPYYLKDPDLYRTRVLTETFARVLTNAQDKFFVGGDELRLLISREAVVPVKPGTQPSPAN